MVGLWNIESNALNMLSTCPISEHIMSPALPYSFSWYSTKLQFISLVLHWRNFGYFHSFTNTNNDLGQSSYVSAIYQENEFQEAELPHWQPIAGAHLAPT